MVQLSAPAAPGRLGQAPDANALLAYQTALEAWLAARRTELDRLSAALEPGARAAGASSPGAPSTGAGGRASSSGAAGAAPGAAGASDETRGDLVLALGLWQSARTRADEVRRLWDSGRADAVDREKMSALIWGRLDAGAGAGTLSLVEACRLCDALTDQIAERVSFDPHAADEIARRRALRAALVRCDDLAGDDPSANARVQALVGRLDVVAAQAERGADVAGRLGELEVDVARAERDLIVAAAQRRDLDRDRARAAARAAELEADEPTLHELVARARREIAAPPRLAVPDVSRLGEPPTDRAALDAHVARLEQVARAMVAVRDAYTAPLRRRAALRYALTSAGTRANANGRAASPTVAAALAEASAAVEATPCDLVLAGALVEQVELLARPLPRSVPDRSVPDRPGATGEGA
jgi:hypothetical protein